MPSVLWVPLWFIINVCPGGLSYYDPKASCDLGIELAKLYAEQRDRDRLKGTLYEVEAVTMDSGGTHHKHACSYGTSPALIIIRNICVPQEHKLHGIKLHFVG